MDNNNNPENDKATQARKKRMMSVIKNKPSSKKKRTTPLSDITSSTLHRSNSSNNNVSNQFNNLPLSQMGPAKFSENIQPSTPSASNHKFLPKRNAEELLNDSSTSNNRRLPPPKQVQTTSTRFAHDHSNTIKSQATIRANIESFSRSIPTNQTQSSDVNYNKLNHDHPFRRTIPAVNLLHKFSETIEDNTNPIKHIPKKNNEARNISEKENICPTAVSSNFPQSGTKRKANTMDDSTNVRLNKKRTARPYFVSTSQPVQGILSGLLRSLNGTPSSVNLSSQSNQSYTNPTPNLPSSVHHIPTIFPNPAVRHQSTNISTDAEYFANMSSTQPNNIDQDDNVNDDDSSSDSDQSDNTQADSTSDEDSEDVDDNVNQGQTPHFFFSFFYYDLFQLL
jgi:hypothetical protein